MADKRVVVTGMGVVSPLGLDASSTWEAALAGKSGAGPITKFDASGYKTRIAAEVKDFDPLKWIDRKDLKKMDIFIQYAIACTMMAMEDAGYQVSEEEAERVGVYIGAGLGGLHDVELQTAT